MVGGKRRDRAGDDREDRLKELRPILSGVEKWLKQHGLCKIVSKYMVQTEDIELDSREEKTMISERGEG